MVIAGVVDLIQDNVLRVEYDSTHLADVRGVNRAIEKINNYGFNDQDKTKKRSEKTSKRKEIAPCFSPTSIGHWKNECKVRLEHTALAGNAAIQEFASFQKSNN
jgi:hypothetical protein